MSLEFKESQMSVGSSRLRKFDFDNVTVDHECALQARPSPIPTGSNFVTRLLSIIVISPENPSTKMHFQSSDAIYSEITRHMSSNHWYIIHPFSQLRFYWNSLMALTFYLLYLHTPFMYAFQKGTSREIWCTFVGAFLNTLCALDIFANFFTGFKMRYSNFIVLHHASVIRNYLRSASFWLDFLSTLPFDSIFRLYFSSLARSSIAEGYSNAFFHFSFLMKFLRFASVTRMMKSIRDILKRIKLDNLNTVITVLVLKSILLVQLCICMYKAIASGVFFYLSGEKSKIIEYLLNDDISYKDKYLLILDIVIWALFDTSFNSVNENYIPGKVITAACVIVGIVYNIFFLIQILNVMNTIHAPRTKFYEVMNQLEAYMQMKQFPSHIQKRLRFFYRKKFRKCNYAEDEILGILSEPLQCEIIINTGQLFAERIELFRNIPKSLVSKIASSCKKEQFLPHDLIVKAGSFGDCMFFLGSGTVCVTTTNGKELYHLEDGDHFGEVALILKNRKRIATCTAIEYCEIFILDYASFKKYVQINEAIMQKLTETANIRMKLTLTAEEEHKKQLHEKLARESFDD